ncbi:hypothetical protein N7517_008244 [Penicillium concentricum]|uniref:Uncharacterized protein n=1 Tax=Penicillium concentricum TaxID=293559 RepID=A0A9W9RS08_9EURO|nr:uncharacterized protein N7517_008244 [Penicillium concentricum]KAJ5365358.1 hypothetical protein N7517_008244 [Penicillium concentricum]
MSLANLFLGTFIPTPISLPSHSPDSLHDDYPAARTVQSTVLQWNHSGLWYALTFKRRKEERRFSVDKSSTGVSLKETSRQEEVQRVPKGGDSEDRLLRVVRARSNIHIRQAYSTTYVRQPTTLRPSRGGKKRDGLLSTRAPQECL